MAFIQTGDKLRSKLPTISISVRSEKATDLPCGHSFWQFCIVISLSQAKVPRGKHGTKKLHLPFGDKSTLSPAPAQTQKAIPEIIDLDEEDALQQAHRTIERQVRKVSFALKEVLCCTVALIHAEMVKCLYLAV